MRMARWMAVAGMVLAGGTVGAADDASSKAKALEKAKRVNGTVESVQGEKLTVLDDRNRKQEVTLGANTSYLDTAPMSREDLKVGDRVQAIGTLQPDGSLEVKAVGVLQSGISGVTRLTPEGWTGGSGSAIPSGTGTQGGQEEKRTRPIAGTIESMQGNTVAVKTQSGTRNLKLTAGTQFVQSRPVDKADVVAGDQVQALVAEGKVLAIRRIPAGMSYPVVPLESTTGSPAVIPEGMGSETTGGEEQVE